MLGKFIVIEGPDGSGKTSVVEGLCQLLETAGESVVKVREPGTTAAGEKIREILKDGSIKLNDRAELLLFEAARADLSDKLIQMINKGNVVISDRFALSTEVYQGYAKNLPMDKIKQFNEFACDSLKPTCTYMLCADMKVCIERMHKSRGETANDRFDGANRAYVRRVHKGYAEIASDPTRKDIVVIETNNLTVEEVVAKIYEHYKGLSATVPETVTVQKQKPFEAPVLGDVGLSMEAAVKTETQAAVERVPDNVTPKNKTTVIVPEGEPTVRTVVRMSYTVNNPLDPNSVELDSFIKSYKNMGSVDSKFIYVINKRDDKGELNHLVQDLVLQSNGGKMGHTYTKVKITGIEISETKTVKLTLDVPQHLKLNSICDSIHAAHEQMGETHIDRILGLFVYKAD